MYKKSDLASVDAFSRNKNSINKQINYIEYHPLSYYILGGSDPTGSKLEETSDIGFDTTDSMDFSASIDPLCDPRTSMFDLIEDLGADGVERVEEYMNARKNKPE